MLVAALIVLVLVLAVLGVASTRPDTFRVERSLLIAAPAEHLHGLINDLHRFNTWNPWGRKDPAALGRYEGPTAGPGAAYAWESSKVGHGRMEITDSAAPHLVTMKLDFFKPFKAHNTAVFTLAPQAGSTRVTWAMQGPAPLMTRVMHLLVNVDKMVGRDFEQGLVNLGQQAQAPG